MRGDEELVSTGTAAKQLGVHRGTLVRWWQRGLVTPELITPGGQARWDVASLKRRLRAHHDEGERAP
ncbi:MAG TPA: MerR family transcriptional regulator [Amycolatopsis sp.]|nr:MerR family transcriptional regulator [Amycolatopsis sp.]